jgi:hypothetical protein
MTKTETTHETTKKPTKAGSSKNKKIIIGVIAGVVSVLLIGIVAIVVIVMSLVSKQDYRDAYDASNASFSKLNTSYNDLTLLSYFSSSTTATQIDNKVDSAQKSLVEYKDSTKEITDAKALRNADIKELYDEYKQKSDAYIGYTAEFIASASEALKAIAACEQIGSSSRVSNPDEFKVAIAPCETALAGVDTIADPNLKKAVEAYRKNVKDISAIVEKSSKRPSN